MQMIVCVNKMDTCDYNEGRYNEVRLRRAGAAAASDNRTVP